MFVGRDACLRQTSSNIPAPFPPADMNQWRIAIRGQKVPDEIVSSLFAGQNRPTRFRSQRSSGSANAVARQAVLGQFIGHFDTITGRKDNPTRSAKVERVMRRCDLH